MKIQELWDIFSISLQGPRFRGNVDLFSDHQNCTHIINRTKGISDIKLFLAVDGKPAELSLYVAILKKEKVINLCKHQLNLNILGNEMDVLKGYYLMQMLTKVSLITPKILGDLNIAATCLDVTTVGEAAKKHTIDQRFLERLLNTPIPREVFEFIFQLGEKGYPISDALIQKVWKAHPSVFVPFEERLARSGILSPEESARAKSILLEPFASILQVYRAEKIAKEQQELFDIAFALWYKRVSEWQLSKKSPRYTQRIFAIVALTWASMLAKEDPFGITDMPFESVVEWSIRYFSKHPEELGAGRVRTSDYYVSTCREVFTIYFEEAHKRGL